MQITNNSFNFYKHKITICYKFIQNIVILILHNNLKYGPKYLTNNSFTIVEQRLNDLSIIAIKHEIWVNLDISQLSANFAAMKK